MIYLAAGLLFWPSEAITHRNFAELVKWGIGNACSGNHTSTGWVKGRA